MKKKISTIGLNVILLILGVVTVYPFVWMLASSFKQNKEIMALEQHLLPQQFIIENYINMNAHFNFIRFFANSLLITIVITVLVLYTSTICGFVLSKYKFKGRDLLFGFVLSTMMVPWCVTIIPKYSMIQAFGWMDSYAALIVPAMFSGFGIFMMKQHIASIKSSRRPGLTEPMNFIFSIKLFSPWPKTVFPALPFSSSSGHGRITYGLTW